MMYSLSLTAGKQFISVRMRNILHMACTVLLLQLLAGCAGTTTFTSYTRKMKPLLTDLETRKAVALEQCLVSESKSQDLILYNMERGRIAQILGNVDYSIKDYNCALEGIRVSDEKATISVTDATAQAAAVMVNDNAIPYKGDGYERVMIHNFQALNYLSMKNIESAGIEVRRANFEQEEALKRHEKELEKAREEAEKKKVKVDENNASITKQYAQMDELAGRVKNSFQNAYTFYVSGFVYELMNQPNDAYIDYRKALEIFPDNTYLRNDVERLGKLLGMDEVSDSATPASPRGNISGKSVQPSAEEGELVVLFENGFVPQKEEIKIPLPIPTVGLVAVAFPIYRAKMTNNAPLQVASGSNVIGVTEPICDVRALAVKSLKEKVTGMVIRQTIRAVAKGATAKAADNQDPLMGLLASAYNFFSENADLRSWVTLPADVQIMRVRIPSGSHHLTFTHRGSNCSAQETVEARPGGRTVLRVIRVGNNLYPSKMVF